MPDSLPSDLAAAHAMILAEREARLAAELAGLERGIEIERLKLEIARLRRERFGPSSERSARIEQLELTLEDLEEAVAEIVASAPVMIRPSNSIGPRGGPCPITCHGTGSYRIATLANDRWMSMPTILMLDLLSSKSQWLARHLRMRARSAAGQVVGVAK